jgi:hypothetical protein
MVEYRNFEIDLKANEIRGELVENFVLKNDIKNIPDPFLKKGNPELHKFLEEKGCEKLITEWHGYGACIIKDKIFRVDLWEKKIEAKPIENPEEYLKDITRAKLIPATIWVGKIHGKIPVKIIK